MIIEIDGLTHSTIEEIEYDKFRQESLENIGIKFLRFTNDEIYHSIERVIELIIKKVNYLLLRLNKSDPLLFSPDRGRYNEDGSEFSIQTSNPEAKS